jgi:hypothetical protein
MVHGMPRITSPAPTLPWKNTKKIFANGVLGHKFPRLMLHKPKSYPKISALIAIFCGTLALSTVRSNAAVIVTFEQVGPDVVATWRGQITLGNYLGNDGTSWFTVNSTLGSSGSSRSLIRLGHPNNPGQSFGGGIATVTTLLSQPTGGTNLTNVGPGTPFPNAFGFTGEIFVLPNITGTPNPSFDFDSGDRTYFMTWQDQTLAEIGAASFNNTLAWTSPEGGNNTVSYTTIPEPSTVMLGILGSLCLLRRRRS